MFFYQSIWLLLMIPAGVLLYKFPSQSKFTQILRITIICILVLAMAQLSIKLQSKKGTIVVLADRSASMTKEALESELEVIRTIRKHSNGKGDLQVLSFGEKALIENTSNNIIFEKFQTNPGVNQSYLNNALEKALTLIPVDVPGKVLILSDGNWTGISPHILAPQFASRNISIDYRNFKREIIEDISISNIQAPVSVTPGEFFTITVWVNAYKDQDIIFNASRNNKSLVNIKRKIFKGKNRIIFRDNAQVAGTQIYKVNIKPLTEKSDPIPENNSAKFFIGVNGDKPILCITPSDNSSFANLLKKGLKVTSIKYEDFNWTIEELSQYSAIILENIPASKIGLTGMNNIVSWVKNSSGGLMITGGKNSYGTGGYFKSPLEDIMPVSMELKQEHRKLAMAIVVALDRSGSMGARVDGNQTKMDLANIATAEVLDMLGPHDEFGVIAVDTTPHTIVSLKSAQDAKKDRNKILKMESMGGGIYVYNALTASVQMLLDAKSDTKHIILFADTADAEEPGKYKDLLSECEKYNITVSVIGLGTSRDKDAQLLIDVAKRGNGQHFFTDRAKELPSLFAQDTFVIARNTFLDEPVNVEINPNINLLTNEVFGDKFSIGGCNLTYLRPKATLSAFTKDDYQAPVVTSWFVGSGRVLCYAGEVDGEFTGNIKSWEKCGSFFSSLARWTAGDKSKLPQNMVLEQNIENGINIIRLHLDPERDNDSFSELPVIKTIVSNKLKKNSISTKKMKWQDADTLVLYNPLYGNDIYLSTVYLPDSSDKKNIPITLSPVCLPYSPEFNLSNLKGVDELDNLANITNGSSRVNLQDIWADLPEKPQNYTIAPYLITLAIILFLLEIFERRTAYFAKKQKINPIKKDKPKNNLSNKKAEVSTSEKEDDNLFSALDELNKRK